MGKGLSPNRYMEFARLCFCKNNKKSDNGDPIYGINRR
jgi:hypothetical protein